MVLLKPKVTVPITKEEIKEERPVTNYFYVYSVETLTAKKVAAHYMYFEFDIDEP